MDLIPTPLSQDALRAQVIALPGLPSLSEIRRSYRELVEAEEYSVTRLAKLIRKDPGLAVRLLQRANSPDLGLKVRILSLEDAILHVGSSTIRNLALMAPVVSDLRRLGVGCNWGDLWRHCVGTAILTQELLSSVSGSHGDLDYLAGLIHDVGWIVLRTAFPAHHDLIALILERSKVPEDPEKVESTVLGTNHAMLGGWYLGALGLDELLVKTSLLHGVPEGAGVHGRTIAAVQIADQFMASIGVGHVGDPRPKGADQWQEVSGWRILMEGHTESVKRFAVRRLEIGAPRLLAMVDAVVGP
jgi:HD-like signal output (HDOD) protein